MKQVPPVARVAGAALVAAMTCLSPLRALHAVPSFAGHWAPLDSSEALVPSTFPVRLVNSMGGPLVIAQDEKTLVIENGVVRFNWPLDGRPTLVIDLTLRADAPYVNHLQSPGHAVWDGDTLRLQGNVPPGRTVLRLACRLDGDDLLIDRTVADDAASDPSGVIRLRYRRSPAPFDPPATRVVRF